MCYYATTDFLCGDWKWGNMMLRCPRQHRIGETCGAKLVHHESITKSTSICKICEEISTKQRRLTKTNDNISRWGREPDKFSASLEKAQREGKELEDKIRELHNRRPSIATNLHSAARPSGSSRAGTSSAATTLPPLTSLSSSVPQGYEYTSTPGLTRRQETGGYSIPRNGLLPAASTSSGLSSGSGQMGIQYGNIPAANYSPQPLSAGTIVSSNMALDRRGSSYSGRR